MLVMWLTKLPERPRAILKTCAYGFVAGLVAVAFQLAMNGCYRAGIVRLSHYPITTFLWSSLVLILGTSLISGWLLNSFCADAAGSGIPNFVLNDDHHATASVMAGMTRGWCHFRVDIPRPAW